MATREGGVGDGGPAFPGLGKVPSYAPYGQQSGMKDGFLPGMSLRDYFAAKAINAMFFEIYGHGCDLTMETVKGYGEQAYNIADALLAARGNA